MAFQVARDGDHRYRLMGELDLATAGNLYRQLSPVVRDGRDVLVDASALTFIDIAGLRALAGLGDRCMNGGRIVLQRPTAPVRRLLVLVGTERFPNVVVRDGESPD
jgi:anti-anti-sigma factor